MEFAIVGAALRLPGVRDIDQFHRRLLAAESGLRAVSREDSLRAGVPPDRVSSTRYVARASVVEDAEHLDAEYFGLTAGEAASIDPQQRLLLTLAHEALESSGVDPQATRVGIYVSTTLSSRYLQPAAAAEQAAFDYQPLLGNDKDFGGVRVAHKLGLTGPALSVQSACSSSLVAVHQACAALAFGDADAALAGGVSLSIPQLRGYLYQEGGVLSPTGECRPFDADSNGTVKGNGGGVVMLRRLDDALIDGDEVLAVISGSAVNNDGSQRMGFTAPSPAGQQCVLSMALRRANVAADDVRYIETHGTGTPLGDPIEYKALRKVYGHKAIDRSQQCYLGSIKASFGHLDAAAGIVGLLKTALVARHSQVYAQTNYDKPNPLIDLESTRFAIPTETAAFPPGGYTAVSSFGMGGTNAHAVVRALRAEERGPTHPADGAAPMIVCVRARSAASVLGLCASTAQYLRRRSDVTVADVATTLQRRTVSGAAYRVTVATVDELVTALNAVTIGDIDVYDTKTVASSGLAGRRIWLPPTPLEECVVLAPETTTPGAPDDDAPLSLRELFVHHVTSDLGGEVSDSTDFFAAGGESIALVDIVGKLTETFDFIADFAELDGLSTVGAMITALEGQAGRTARGTDPLLTFGPPNDVYFHPPAGGTNFCYSALHRVAPHIGFHAFRARFGEDSRSIEATASRNIAILEEADRISERLIVGGYSFGGNVGLEMALQLQRSGRIPRRLVLFDSIPPTAYLGTAQQDSEFDDGIALVIRQATAGGARPGQLDAFADIIGDNGSSAGALYQDFARLWRDNQRALAAYKPAEVLHCPITLFSTEEALLAEETEYLGIAVTEPTEWQRYTAMPLEVITVPGNHYSLFLEPANMTAVAAALPGVLVTVPQ